MGTVLRLAVAVLALGCGGESEEKSKDEVASGRALFIRNGCAVCHGESGRGDGQIAASLKPPPRDFRDLTAYKKGSSQEAIALTIKRGVPGSTMRGYPHISAADRRLIAIYIRSLQGEAIRKEE